MIEKQIIKLLNSYGLEAYLCGGTARDRHLGRTPAGYDIAVNATLSDLRRLLQAKIIRVNEYDISITISYMEEDFVLYPLKKIKLMNTYFNYEFTDSLEEDSSTKDFTINALYYDPIKDKWYDFQDGIKDLKSKVIRFVGDPETRVLESKVRLVRALVLCGILGQGWSLDRRTHEAIDTLKLKAVPIHPRQFYVEMSKALIRSEQPSRVFKLLRSTKLIETVFPELKYTIGVEQSNKSKNLDLFEHIMYTIDSVSTDKPNVLLTRLAGLLHDIGKPYTQVYTNTGVHFYNHENVGAYLSERIMSRWGFSKGMIETVSLLIKSHLFDISPIKSDNSVKKLISKVGSDNIHNLLDLRMADRAGINRKMDMKKIYILRDKVNKQLAKISPDDFKLQLSDDAIRKAIKKKTDNIDLALIEAKDFLKHKVIYGRVMNKASSLRKALNKINVIECPLDKPHLFKTWRNLQHNTADIFPDGGLKCGVFCNFICNDIIKNKK